MECSVQLPRVVGCAREVKVRVRVLAAGDGYDTSPAAGASTGRCFGGGDAELGVHRYRRSLANRRRTVMPQPLNRVLEREKSAYKSLKSDLKSLRKRADDELDTDEVYGEFRELRSEIAEAIDLLATRELGDAETSTDVVVEGETILEQVPVRFLVVLEKHLKRMRKVVWEIDEGTDDERIDRFSDRLEKLFLEVRTARQEANLTRVEERNVSDRIFDYLFDDPESEPDF
jgi:hypothetical protein